MVHEFAVAIHMDDEKIVKDIEETAEKKILDAITERTLDIISEKRYGYYKNRDFSPLNRMVKDQINVILEDNKELIIDGAIKELANKLSRTKAVKEKVSEL